MCKTATVFGGTVLNWGRVGGQISEILDKYRFFKKVEYQMTSLKPQSLISARAMSLATVITSCILLFLRCLISSWFAFYLSCRLPLSPFCLLRATLCRLLFAPSLFITLVCIPSWCFFCTGLLSITPTLCSSRPILTGLILFSPWRCLGRCRTSFVDLLSLFCLVVLF